MIPENIADQEGIVINEDEIYGSKGEGYSYPSLVMNILKKTIEAGSMELKEGYWNNRFDKMGNAHKVWIPDQRNIYLQTISILKCILEREYDPAITEDMDKLQTELEDSYKKHLEFEREFWKNANPKTKQYWNSKGASFVNGCLNEKLQFYQDFINYSVKIAKKEFILCLKLIKKLGDFKDEGITG